MSDDDKKLVERLRGWARDAFHGRRMLGSDQDIRYAADRIEAQAAEIERLRAQLQAKEDGLNVRDRRIEAQAAEIERLQDRIETQEAEIERLREALGDLIEQCWSCEMELTEEYYGTHYSGESLPLCNARAALGGNDE